MLIAASLIRFLSYNEVDTPRYAATGGLSKLFVDTFWQDKTLYIRVRDSFLLRLQCTNKMHRNIRRKFFVLDKIRIIDPIRFNHSLIL